MASSPPPAAAGGILFKGEVYTIPKEKSLDRPRYWYFPGSLNAQKGRLFLRCCSSSLDFSTIDFRCIEYPEYNQTLEFAKICPNMSIPVLEIDDKIITDSRDIQRYLTEKYPSKGDAAVAADEGKTKKMEEFIESCLTWDEYLFSYRKLPNFLGASMHHIRLVCLSDAILDAAKDNSGINIDEDALLDGRTIREAYVRKIAQIRSMIQIGCEAETPELTKRISANDDCMDEIFRRASTMLTENSGVGTDCDDNNDASLLMGGDSTNIASADIYLAVAVIRMKWLDESYLDSKFDKYPNTRLWWEHFLTLPEAQVLLEDNDKRGTVLRMIKSGKPFKMLGCALGIYKAKPLPDDIERDVQAELKKLNEAYFSSN